MIIELSGGPTRLPTRHPEGDKCKLDRCLVDVLNNLFYDYNVCEFELAKKLKVFGLQTIGKIYFRYAILFQQYDFHNLKFTNLP